MTREEIINEIKCLLSELNNGEDAVSYLTQNDVKWLNENIKVLEQEPCEDAISRQAVLDIDFNRIIHTTAKPAEMIRQKVEQLSPVTPQPETGHCENCKHFRKLPYHADTLGKCVHHTGFCPKGDWYCADFDPQESEG